MRKSSKASQQVQGQGVPLYNFIHMNGREMKRLHVTDVKCVDWELGTSSNLKPENILAPTNYLKSTKTNLKALKQI